MKPSPFYLLIHKEAVVGADKNYMNNPYIKSVIAGMEGVMMQIPKEDMGELREGGLYQHFLDKPGNAERIGEKGRKILVFGGFYSEEGDLWCVNTEVWDLQRKGYTNVEIIEDATLIREKLHGKRAASNV